MTVAGIRDNIQTAIDLVTGLRALDTMTDSINELPAAMVRPTGATFHQSFGGLSVSDHQFEVSVFVARGGDVGEAQDTLDAFLNPDGTTSNSLVVALASTDVTTGTNGDFVVVTGYRDYGILEYNNTPYVGCIIEMTVGV